MLRIIETIKKRKQEKEKKEYLEKYGRYVAPDGVVYFDLARWTSPTRRRKSC